MLGRALSYLVLFSTLGIILRWSYGVRLLSAAETIPSNSQSYLPTSIPPIHPTSSPEQIFSSIQASTEESEPLLEEEEVGKHREGKRSNASSPTAVNEEEVERVGENGKSRLTKINEESRNLGSSETLLKPEASLNPVYSFPNIPSLLPSSSKQSVAASSVYETDADSISDSDSDSDEPPRSVSSRSRKRTTPHEEEEDLVWGVPKSRKRLAPDNPFDDSEDARSDGSRIPLGGGRSRTRRGKWRQWWEVKGRKRWIWWREWGKKWIANPGEL
jgi:hypothetical protein